MIGFEKISCFNLMGPTRICSNENVEGLILCRSKSKRYIIHLDENVLLRERIEPKSLRTEYQVNIGTQLQRKLVNNHKDESEVKS